MKVSYYPGCSLEGTAKEYGRSLAAVAEILGIELDELEGWTCCGASSAHIMNDRLATALPARNLMIADKAGLDLVVPCSACYQRLKAADKEIRSAKTDSYKGSFKIKHAAEFIWEGVGERALKQNVKKRLSGLNPVCYYGCLTSRPPRVTDSPNPEDPQAIDNIMTALGANVRNWSFKADCCGGSLMFTQPDVAKKLTARLLDMALEAGADCVVAACPVCQSNLDTRQDEISRETGKSYHLPIFYFTELMGLAFACPDNWLSSHFVDPMPLLKQKGLV